mgnify:CR=1 FL=1
MNLHNIFLPLEDIFQAEEGVAEFDNKEILVILIEAYENEYYPIKPSAPI